MPVLNGIEPARQLRKKLPNTKLILLTMHSDVLYVREALRLGISAYVLKHSAASELLLAIQVVQRGRKYKASCRFGRCFINWSRASKLMSW